jgi:anti-sigma factor ChrR (cupin superfamily)
MSFDPDKQQFHQSELLFLHAVRALPSSEARAVEAHLAACATCRRDLATLGPVIDSFASWPTDVLRPATPLWPRLAQRVAAETGTQPYLPASREWTEPEWAQVAPGISVKLLATDRERDRVSMLVRLAPGTDYPPHTHAGVEELHLLEGELWIDDRKLHPGAYNRAEPGTADKRVWSETGCTCVLMTSTQDSLG